MVYLSKIICIYTFVNSLGKELFSFLINTRYEIKELSLQVSKHIKENHVPFSKCDFRFSNKIITNKGTTIEKAQ